MISDKFVHNRVSVIIPTYNYAHFVLDAIESALAQNFPDMEIIVVDDGSTDGTRSVLRPYMGRVKYIYQENAGLSAARNTGIEWSTGEFIQFLDADDLLGVNTIKSQVHYLKNNPNVSIAVVRSILFRKKKRNGRPKSISAWALPRTDLDVHLCYFNIAPLHAFMFKRQAIVKTGWFDTELAACEDYDFWLRAAVRGFIPYYNPLGRVYYRRHPESLSANLRNQYSHDAILHKRLSKILDENPDFPKGKRLEGLLAFIAGAVLTANRLLEHRMSGTVELMRLALRRIKEAEKIVNAQKEGWNILTKLFCFRVYYFLNFLRVRELSESCEILASLRQILLSLGAPISKTALVAEYFKSILVESPQFIVEKLEMGELAHHYLRNRLSREKVCRTPNWTGLEEGGFSLTRLLRRLLSGFL